LLRIVREKFLAFLALLGVCLGIIIPLLLVTYASETASTGQRVAVIAGGSLGSIALAIAFILSYAGIRWAFCRRRRPWAWVAIFVMEAASGKPAQSVSALGISHSGGSLIVSLPRERNDFLAVGDSFVAANVHTKENLGAVEVISVASGFCLCEVIDRMESPDFWAGLENRMAHDFSPPSGVEFSRYINSGSIDSVMRLIRKWGG
jgi:hypothetical protein